MRVFLYYVYIFILSTSIGSCERHHEHDYSHTVPYAPLAAASISIDANNEKAFSLDLRQFASENRYEFVGSDDHVTVGAGNVNDVIWVGRDSFFYATNLMSGTKLILIAHSHEGQRVWRPPWERLLVKLRAKYKLRILPITSGGVSGF